MYFQVKWYRDTMLLDPNEFRLMEQFGIRHTLVLRKVSDDDFGNYSCSAENHLGKSRAFIEVSGTISIHSENSRFFMTAVLRAGLSSKTFSRCCDCSRRAKM